MITVHEVYQQLRKKEEHYYSLLNDYDVAKDNVGKIHTDGMLTGLGYAMSYVFDLLPLHPRMSPKARQAYEAYVDTLQEPDTMKAPELDGAA